MLLLTSITDKLQLIVGSAGAIDVHASWLDNAAGAVQPGRTNTNISTATTADIVPSPAASTQRNIKTLHVRNRGASANTVTVQHTDGTTVAQLHQVTLAAGQTLQYIDEIGFIVPAATTGGGGGGSTFTGLVATPQGRLTLVSNTPIMNSNALGQGTVYYTPYSGRFVPFYDGTNMSMVDVGAELSQTTTDTTKSPAAVAPSKNYDIFVWNDAGTYRATRGPAWPTDTSRGTGAGTSELTRINGILLNNQTITNGPAAQRGTFVGTIRSNGSSLIDWQFGSNAVGGGQAIFGICNSYNRSRVTTLVTDSNLNYTYNGGLRSVDNSNTYRISFVRALDEDGIQVRYQMTAVTDMSTTGVGGIGLDSTTALASGCMVATQLTGGIFSPAIAVWDGYPGIGFHFVQALEQTLGAGVAPTFWQMNTNAQPVSGLEISIAL